MCKKCELIEKLSAAEIHLSRKGGQTEVLLEGSDIGIKAGLSSLMDIYAEKLGVSLIDLLEHFLEVAKMKETIEQNPEDVKDAKALVNEILGFNKGNAEEVDRLVETFKERMEMGKKKGGLN